ncbi:MAG: HD domain-containing protein [Spirochaetes bacterium]|nr:HD domain-containing protein [Spirochaetota bacterium]
MKLTSENIKNSLSQVRLKFSILNNPIVFFNKQRKFVYYNRPFFRIFQKVIQDQNFEYIKIFNHQNKIDFQKISIQELLNSPTILYYTNYAPKDYIFKIFTYKSPSFQGKNLYFSILFEISDVKEQLVAESITALIKASQLKDNDTGNHIQRINNYSQALAAHIYQQKKHPFPQIDNFYIDQIGKVASMHDVGKIGIPDYILTKPARLTNDEFKIMQEHTINGAFILSELAGQMARDIALFHHEKFNGDGYPYQLREDQIPLCARIVAIVDVYDALRMARSYKPAFSHDKSVSIILQDKGTHFDPYLVDYFIEIQDQFISIYDSLKEEPD